MWPRGEGQEKGDTQVSDVDVWVDGCASHRGGKFRRKIGLGGKRGMISALKMVTLKSLLDTQVGIFSKSCLEWAQRIGALGAGVDVGGY